MVALALVLPVTASNTSTFTRVPACDHSLHYVADFLVAHGRARVWGSYWLAGDLALCEHTRLDAAAVAPTRDAAAEREATAAPLSTYVVFPQNALDNEIARWTAAHDPGAERALVAGYAVWSFAHQVRPSVMGLDSAF
jgi:hypothetical protein